ncbi:MAG TPA: DUF6279 family lipoprotein [Fibrobacteria bacterium]|nr:DUF6279 family lipoprotein [Fibrobacteria bacterium]
MSFRLSAKWKGSVVLAAGAALALALAGCNKLKLGYEYADWLMVYSVEDNFDLDKAQRSRLKEDVDGYFRWHRTQMLPVYADFLAFVADSVRNGLRPSEVDSGYARYKALFKRTMEPVTDKSVNLLSALTPQQVDDWLEKQRKKNQKLRKEFSGSIEDRLDHRFHKIVDEMEDWTGRLTKEQKTKIKALNATLPWNGNLWLDMREKVQEHLGELLKKKAPQAELRGYLSTYYLETDSLRSEEYRIKNKEFETRLRTLIYVIHNTLTYEQKRHFIQQVEKLERDFRALSKQE